MKNSLFISLCCYIMTTFGQITGTLTTTTLDVYTKNLNGFNLGGGFGTDGRMGICNVCNNCDGQSYPNYKNVIEDLGLGNNVTYRFYTGELGNYYNRWYGGLGSYQATTPGFQANTNGTNLNATAREAIYGRPDPTNPSIPLYYGYNDIPSITNSYQTISPAQPKNNYIFPFIKLITDDRQKIGNCVFNLPIAAHYRDYRGLGIFAPAYGINQSFASTYSPRLETFAKASVIATINDKNSLLTNSNLSSQFKEIVQQNLDAFITLIKNKVKVTQIELGNEFYDNGRMEGNGISCVPTLTDFETNSVIPNTSIKTYYNNKVWLKGCNLADRDKTIRAYGSLCRMYIKLYRETVQTLYDEETNVTKKAFYLDIKNNLKFGVPMSAYYWSTNNGYMSWDIYLRDHKDINATDGNGIGFDAYVYHDYFQPAPNYMSLDVDTRFNNLRTHYVNRFNTFFKTDLPNSIMSKFTNTTDLWITEWKDEPGGNDVENTLLHGMAYVDRVMDFLDFNSNLNLTGTTFNIKNAIKLANRQLLWSNYGSANDVATLLGISYNTPNASIKYRTNFYAHKLLLPIFENPSLRVVNQNNGGINYSSYNDPNLYFRSFVADGSGLAVPSMPDYTFVNTLYIYFNNKSSNDYSINIQNTVQNYLTSILPTQIYSVVKSQISGDKLYASIGKGPTNTKDVAPFDAGYLPVNISDFNISMPNTSWQILPISKYSVGYYKVDIIRKTGGGGTGSRVKNSKEEIPNENIYPNPTKDKLTIDLFSNQKSTGNLEIYNMEGKMVQSNSIDLSEGNNSAQINVSTLPSASYIVKINYNETSISKKIEIIK